MVPNWGHDIHLSGSCDVVGHVTIQYPIGHVLFASLGSFSVRREPPYIRYNQQTDDRRTHKNLFTFVLQDRTRLPAPYHGVSIISLHIPSVNQKHVTRWTAFSLVEILQLFIGQFFVGAMHACVQCGVYCGKMGGLASARLPRARIVSKCLNTSSEYVN